MKDDLSRPLRFALLGCGRAGERHAAHAGKFGTFVCACDADPANLEKVTQTYGVKGYTDINEMLQSIKNTVDVVAVCTPNHLHCQHSIQILEAGLHVICEKPMAITVQECGEMIKAAERANRRLFVVKQNRYNPPVEHLKNLLDNGSLGRIYSAHLNCFWNRDDKYFKSPWKGKLRFDGGTLYTQFSHFIDLLYWLVGDVQDVAAFVDNYCHADSVEFEDAGVAILRFYNGAIGSVSFTINSHARNMEGSLTLFCEHGTIKIGGQYLNEIEYQQIRNMPPAQLRTGRPPNEYGEYQGSMSNHEDIYANVASVLMTGGTIGTIGFEGLKTVEIIDKIYRAAGRSK